MTLGKSNYIDKAGQHMFKASDLSIYSQDEIDDIAFSLNTRPRMTFGYRTPLAIYSGHIVRLQV